MLRYFAKATARSLFIGATIAFEEFFYDARRYLKALRDYEYPPDEDFETMPHQQLLDRADELRCPSPEACDALLEAAKLFDEHGHDWTLRDIQREIEHWAKEGVRAPWRKTT